MSFVATFFLVVLVLAVSELYLLVQAAAAMGFLATLGLCVLTGILGGALVRHQGIQTLRRLQRELAAGRLPADEILEGIVLLIVGALLCVPGFITDLLGALMLIPPLRRAVIVRVRKRLASRITVHTMPGGQDPFGMRRDRDVIDVEVTEVRDVEERDEGRGMRDEGA